MDNIQKDLVELLVRQNVAYTTLLPADAKKWETSIRAAFGDPRKKSGPLWEALEGGISYQGEEGANAARTHLSELRGPVILLIDDWKGYSAIEISRGADLANVLEESYNFRWYVTNSSVDFVLCRNDHDFVTFCSR